MNLKELFGLQTKTEKVNKYRALLKERNSIEQNIQSLADIFSFEKSQYETLLKSENVDERKQAIDHFNEFSTQQAKSIEDLYKKKKSIEKSMDKYMADEEVSDLCAEIKKLDDTRNLYYQGKIKKSIYFDLLKAKTGKTHFADVLLFNKDGELLILQRAAEDNSGSATDKWCIPGGHVDPGEDFLTAARRELYEETGFELPVDKFFEVAKYENKDCEIHYFQAYLPVESHTTVLVDGFEEVGSMWVQREEVDDYDFIYDMKNNLRRILGLEIPENEKVKFMMILKSFQEGKISNEVFQAFVKNNPDILEKSNNKTYFSHSERKDLAEKGEAMPDGKYPIRNKQDLKDAIRLSGSSSTPKSEVKKWIKKRAKELGLESELPEDWIEKDMGVVEAQTLSKESLDKKEKGPQGSGVGDDIKKAITFKKQVYESKVVESSEVNKYRNGKITFSVSDQNEGKEIEKLADMLAVVEKLTSYRNSDNKFKIKIETEDNGEQEWKFDKGFYLSYVTKEETIRKSEEDDLNIEKSGVGLNLIFNNIEEAEMFKSLIDRWNESGRIDLMEEPEMIDYNFQKSENQRKKDFKDYLNFLEGIKTRIKNIHWNEEDNSKHKYLDDLSDEVSEFEDKFAEAGQSEFGRFKNGEINGEEIEEDDPIKLVDLVFERTKEMRKKLEDDENYIGEISWIDDFLASLKQSKYRLQMD